jgi:hypothetical protein
MNEVAIASLQTLKVANSTYTLVYMMPYDEPLVLSLKLGVGLVVHHSDYDRLGVG